MALRTMGKNAGYLKVCLDNSFSTDTLSCKLTCLFFLFSTFTFWTRWALGMNGHFEVPLNNTFIKKRKPSVMSAAKTTMLCALLE